VPGFGDGFWESPKRGKQLWRHDANVPPHPFTHVEFPLLGEGQSFKQCLKESEQFRMHWAR
jgi:hypothetical protein